VITGKTSVYAVFGNPVEHSLSPVIHNYGFSTLGIDAVYVAFKADNAKIVADSIRGLGIKGASITIPFKIDIINYLDELDDNARLIGAVNTIVNEDFRLIGKNTDGIGSLIALKEVSSVNNKTIMILGYGGAARAIAFTLIDKVNKIYVYGRNESKAASLIEDLNRFSGYKKVFFTNSLVDYDILINTTPLGMNDEIPVPVDFILPKTVVFDIVYRPKDTNLIKEAKKVGCSIVYGYKMLLYQALEQFRIWTSKNIPQDLENLLLQSLYS